MQRGEPVEQSGLDRRALDERVQREGVLGADAPVPPELVAMPGPEPRLSEVFLVGGLEVGGARAVVRVLVVDIFIDIDVKFAEIF